jgi:hypothetical protein
VWYLIIETLEGQRAPLRDHSHARDWHVTVDVAARNVCTALRSVHVCCAATQLHSLLWWEA